MRLLTSAVMQSDIAILEHGVPAGNPFTKGTISMRSLIAPVLFVFLLPLVSAAQAGDETSPYLVVLGVAQDGGIPQAGSRDLAWENPSLRRYVSCLAIVDPYSGGRWLLDATPDFPEQLRMLDTLAPPLTRPGISGILLTHAHMGHYTGLMHLGLEVMGSKNVPVYVMPRMAEFLRTNGPWSQLVKYGNIALREMRAGETVALTPSLSVTPLLVPHRQEFSEVVGFRISGPNASALFIPDIDRWEQLDSMGTRIEDLITDTDVAYLDGTFFGEGEIPGRSMAAFPHPLITSSIDRFARLSATERSKIRFIHFNHTNRALYPGVEQDRIVKAGHRIAEEGERFGL